MKKGLMRKKRKSSTNDSFLLKALTVGLSFIVLVVVIGALFIRENTVYVAKVGDRRIYTYEYEYYLDKAMYDLNQLKPKTESTSEQQTSEDNKKYWTTPDKDGKTNIDKAKANAMESIKSFKVAQILASKEGVKLTAEEKAKYRTQIDSTALQYQQYGMPVEYMTGGMSLKNYKKYAVDGALVDRYITQKVIPSITFTDEEYKKHYEDNLALYRTLSIRTIFVSKTDSAGQNLSDDAWNAKKANANLWLASINDGSKKMDELVREHSDSTDKATTDGLYTFNEKNPGINDTKLKDEVLKIDKVQDTAQLLETDLGIYIIKCESIDTFDESKEDTVKTKVKSDYQYKVANENIKAKSNSDYKLTNVKQKNMDNVFDRFKTAYGL